MVWRAEAHQHTAREKNSAQGCHGEVLSRYDLAVNRIAILTLPIFPVPGLYDATPVQV
jgi:hypothetical protein